MVRMWTCIILQNGVISKFETLNSMWRQAQINRVDSSKNTNAMWKPWIEAATTNQPTSGHGHLYIYNYTYIYNYIYTRVRYCMCYICILPSLSHAACCRLEVDKSSYCAGQPHFDQDNRCGLGPRGYHQHERGDDQQTWGCTKIGL